MDESGCLYPFLISVYIVTIVGRKSGVCFGQDCVRLVVRGLLSLLFMWVDGMIPTAAVVT